ncbi:MAG: NAD(P)H-dependent oxidoreductase [Candidatus Kariarchaeaceae archaeon]
MKTHTDEIIDIHGLIIIHPNWWGQPPAILKGWVDRVFRPGIAYTLNGEARGLLNVETAVVFNTSDTPPEIESEVFGDPLGTIWKDCILEYCGVKNFFRKTYSVIITSSLRQRKIWLRDVEKIVDDHFPPLL